MKLNELIRRKTDGEKENTPKEPLTHEQQQRRKKMLIYPLMGLMFLGSMWLIFAPSAEEKEQEQTGTGFNTDMPLPTDAVIIGDKSKAYEQASLEAKRKERDRAVQDLASLFEGGEAEKENTEDEEYDLLIGMDRANLRSMYRICGGDFNDKMHLLMDFTDRPGEVADPWYTDDFDTTWRDVEEGCRGLLQKIISKEVQTSGQAGC